MAGTLDGFRLARLDLEQRREGDVLGASQAGRRSSLENLRVLRDEDTIVAARAAAESLLAEDPALTEAPLLADAVTDGHLPAADSYSLRLASGRTMYNEATLVQRASTIAKLARPATVRPNSS